MVFLKIERAAVCAKATPAAGPSPVLRQRRALMKKTVIIADDEPITRMDLADMLRELGFSVVGEAADGFDAVELCRAKRPDVVLMDVKMPIFDGLTAAETILSEELAGCVVLLTAFSDRDIVQRAGSAGVTGYLVKPVDERSLLPTIEVALAQSLRLRESRARTRAAERRVREDRQVHKAQQLLARSRGCSEEEAYRIMRKAAMDKRISVAALAERIIQQAAKTDDVAVVKAWLATHKGLCDEKAYRYIVNYGKTHGCSVEEAARELRSRLPAEA